MGIQEVSDANDDLQANQRDLYSDELHQDLRVARLRTRELEHDCRKLRRIVDETELLQSQLEQTSQECVEWQRRHTYVMLRLIHAAQSLGIC